jgi:sugar phosphate isomerase/epimerase
MSAGAPVLGWAGSVLAQTPVNVAERLRLEGRYLPQYLDLQEQTAAGVEAARWQLSQYAALLGDETTALGVVAQARRPNARVPDLTGATAIKALEVIVQAAANRQIVILNEAHNHSRHRAFAAQLLRRLRPLGFEWFAAEAFMPRQPGPAPLITNYRVGEPFLHSYGYYSQDPVFAETVREAARLGYNLIDYEFRRDQYAPDGSDMDTRMAYREEAEAENLIANVLRPYPNARILVYCGYSHAMESPTDHGEWFAARLKRKTGVDPLTIEQASNTPSLRPEDDEAHVAAVQTAFAFEDPVIVRRADGSVVGMPLYEGQMDLSVFHPRLDPVRGRPGWLAADSERRLVDIDVPETVSPALLQALWAEEGFSGVPADQFLLAPNQRQATVSLRPGRYTLRIERPDGFDPAFGQIEVSA